MKLQWRNTAIFGVWLIALIVVVTVQQRCKQGQIASALQARGITLVGPDVEGMKRLKDKQQIVNDFLAGRTSLIGAGAAFRRLDDGASSRWIRAPETFPNAASEEEAYCLSVMVYLHRAVPTERSEEIGNRLQSEVNAMFPSRQAQTTDAHPLLGLGHN
jgi:hypothetical protein